MEDNVSVQPIEISEAQKNVEQIASIWGVIKNIWYGVLHIFDNLAPTIICVFGTIYALTAYENTINDTKTLLEPSVETILGYGVIGLLLRKIWQSLMELRK